MLGRLPSRTRAFVATAAAALVLPVLTVTAAPAAAADGSVTGTVTQPGYGGAQPLWGARVTLSGVGVELSLDTDQSGGYRFPAVPAGEFQVTASDPYTNSYLDDVATVTVAEAQSVVAAPLLLERDWSSQLPWAVCAEGDLGPCVESLTATDGTDTYAGTPTGEVRMVVSQTMPLGGVAWGPSHDESTEIASRDIGWDLLLPDRLTVALQAQVPPAWSTGGPLSPHRSRLFNAYLEAAPGEQLPAGWAFAVTVRGVEAPKVVTGLMSGARVTSTGESVTVSGAPVRVVDGPMAGLPEDPSHVRERFAWFADFINPYMFPCSSASETPLTLMTNSFRMSPPQVVDGVLAVTVAGSHYDFPYDPEVQKINDTGFFEVALPEAFVTQATDQCPGWGLTLAEAAAQARGTVSEGGQVQEGFAQTAVVRGNELVVTLTGFHFSMPTIEVGPVRLVPSAVAYSGASKGVWTNKKSTVSFNATVSSADPTCLAGREVTFTAGGDSRTAVTDAQGRAAAAFSAAEWLAGDHPVTLELAASATCAADSTTAAWHYATQKPRK